MRSRALATLVAAFTAALVLALVSAVPAQAATVRTWDRIARCESGGNWHINTHNGYYGGLQISGGTWRAYKGNRYASLPHRATKREQIRIAEKIKRGQGWRAWPSCSRRVGLRP
jgi:hypothetical protein